MCKQEITDSGINQGNSKNRYYINNVELSGGIFDMTLKCSYHDGEYTEEQCSIVMSPQHAKALLAVVESYVASYEEGIMPLPMGGK